MEAVEYLRTKARMCEALGTFCSGCPLLPLDIYDCGLFESRDPVEAVEIVKAWGEMHPEEK